MNGRCARPSRTRGWFGLTDNDLHLDKMSQNPHKVYRTIARLGGVLLLLLGVLVLLGWLWHIDLLTTVLPGRITMKPNSAIGFLFLGFAAFLLAGNAKTRTTRLCCGSLCRGSDPNWVAYVVRVSFPL